ncbi:yciC [Symbiodinium necroappetens]|uniref:YciC protein n=1 Tax=Symbiodinium necroappetens TaxID=1628268 RepID=A0A812R895_9DINO|nr:yciC [Symbiodinium necroappetens]
MATGWPPLHLPGPALRAPAPGLSHGGFRARGLSCGAVGRGTGRERARMAPISLCAFGALATFVPAASRQRARPRKGVTRFSADVAAAEVTHVPGKVTGCPECDEASARWHDAAENGELLPVTVLSGFLGSGKTTLLKHILRSAGSGDKACCPDGPDQYVPKVAVIVNDMGDVNLDASEIKSSKLIQEEATMVEMHNGCICCTLRGDLLKTVKALSEEKAFDYLVIESTGIAEPMPVAQTFVMDVDDLEEGDMDEEYFEEEVLPEGATGGEWEEVIERPTEGQEIEIADMADMSAGDDGELASELQSLSHFARLDTMVTVVDALNIYDVLSSLEMLNETNIAGMTGNDIETDDRSIAQLMLDQIEFANVILLSKAHLVKDKGAVQEIRALLQKLNPSARIIVPAQPQFADVPLNELINTHLFDMEAAESSAGWMQELAKAAEGGPGHTPETEEYNISSMVFRSHERPFHPGRLATVLAGVGDYASTMTTADSTAAPTVFAGVVRAKGHLWLATANARPIDLHVAGRHVQLGASVVPFLAAMPREEWEEAFHEYYRELVATDSWHAEHGDRGTMLVFIGVGLDKAGIEAELGTALLTDAEMAEGEDAWKALEDPFFGGEYFENSEQLEEPKFVILEE